MNTQKSSVLLYSKMPPKTCIACSKCKTDLLGNFAEQIRHPYTYVCAPRLTCCSHRQWTNASPSLTERQQTQPPLGEFDWSHEAKSTTVNILSSDFARQFWPTKQICPRVRPQILDVHFSSLRNINRLYWRKLARIYSPSLCSCRQF